jgi:hypothetical protein
MMRAIRLEIATIEDAAGIASLRQAVADDLTRRYGEGPWSSSGTEKGVLFELPTAIGRSLSYRAA